MFTTALQVFILILVVLIYVVCFRESAPYRLVYEIISIAVGIGTILGTNVFFIYILWERPQKPQVSPTVTPFKVNPKSNNSELMLIHNMSSEPIGHRSMREIEKDVENAFHEVKEEDSSDSSMPKKYEDPPTQRPLRDDKVDENIEKA